MWLTLYPAIDVHAGQVVRLRQGDYSRATAYGTDPLARAQRHAEDGARWLHLVDLDAARAGGYTLAPLLERIVRTTSLEVQTGGGVRSLADVQRLLDAGAARVVVGSLAVRASAEVADWMARVGASRLTIALDVRRVGQDWILPTHGWTEDSGARLEPLLRGYCAAGLEHLLCTDIARDGMLGGPNLALYRQLAAHFPHVLIQASGGIRDTSDLRAVAAAGCAGAVLGRALLEDCLTLDEALAC